MDDSPPRVCINCARHWRAQAPAARDPLLVCLHNAVAVRKVADSWVALENVTAADAAILRAGGTPKRRPTTPADLW